MNNILTKEQIERRRKSKREWGRRNRLYVTEYHRIWKENNKEYFKEYRKKYSSKRYKENKDKVYAQVWAGKNRNILLDEECCFCDSNKKLELHHPDYNYPERVITICRNCHEYIHRI